MERPYQQIGLERAEDMVCARLIHRRIEEAGIHVLGDELTDLIQAGGCRKLIVSLGPGAPD